MIIFCFPEVVMTYVLSLCPETAMSRNGHVPKRLCSMSRSGYAPKRLCPETAMSRSGYVPKRSCPEVAMSRNGHVPKRPAPVESTSCQSIMFCAVYFNRGTFSVLYTTAEACTCNMQHTTRNKVSLQTFYVTYKTV